MELIASEERRKRNWYYSEGKYIAKQGEVVCATINGADLTDPDIIAYRRQMTQKLLPINQRGLYRIEPDPITKALWNDWQRRQSVGKTEIAD